jgi:hypothetical protein
MHGFVEELGYCRFGLGWNWVSGVVIWGGYGLAGHHDGNGFCLLWNWVNWKCLQVWVFD